MEYYSAIKKNEMLHLQQHGRTWRYKWNESGRERQTLYDITYMGNLKEKNECMNIFNNKNPDLDTEDKLVVTCREKEGG